MKYTVTRTLTRVVRGDCVWADRGGWKPSPLYFIPPRRQVRERGEWRVKPPQSQNIGVFKVHGFSTIKVKEGEISKRILRRMLDVFALSVTKLKGKGEVIFGEVVGRVSGGVEGGRAREGVGLLLSDWLLRCVVEWKEVSSRLMWIRVKRERESWVFISAYGPGSERCEE